MTDNNVISLSDLIEQRLLKQQEIDYFKETLIRLEKKIAILSKEVDITTLIINMIENERVLTIDEKKSKILQLDDTRNKE
jgi:hypothetical protein|tara:strand:+ start:2480 stop:2719 length:240 start_codon:yes stop_codon:yes gene_type:complete